MTIPLAPTMATWFRSTRSLPGKRPQTPTPSSSWRTCGKHSANRMQTSRRSPAPVSKALNCHSSRHTAHLFWVRRFCHHNGLAPGANGPLQAAKALTQKLRPSSPPVLRETPGELPELVNKDAEKMLEEGGHYLEQLLHGFAHILEAAGHTMTDFLVVIDNGQLGCVAHGGSWV